MVWHVDGDYPLIEINCGGGHRSYDLLFNGQGGDFVFIQSRQVMLATWTLAARQTILQVH